MDKEYDLSQMPIMPKGRYAPERRIGSNLILIDPDLARAFPSDKAINKASQLVLQAAQIPEKNNFPVGLHAKLFRGRCFITSKQFAVWLLNTSVLLSA